MNTEIIESGIIFFIFGILLGSVVSIFIVKRLINKRLKNLYNLFNELTLYRLRFKKEQEKKIKALKKITNEIYNSPKSSGHYKNFDSYIFDLNQLLYEKRINQIEDIFPPS